MPKFKRILHPEKFNLILYYAVTSFGVIAVISLAVGWVFPRMESDALVKRSEEYARYFISHLNYEIYKDFLLPTLKRDKYIDLENNRKQVRRLDKTVKENMYGLNIKKLYLYDMNGHIIYSTVPEHVGFTLDISKNKKLECAVHGVSASALRLAGTTDSKGTYVVETLLESYFPFYEIGKDGTKQGQIGVLEIYQNMSGLKKQMASVRKKAIAMTASSMGVLFLVLLLVVRKAARIINVRTNQLIDARNTLERNVEERTLEIREAYKKLQQTQRKLIQNEKLASIGTLVTGLAHEINNPLASVAGCAEGLIERLKTLRSHHYFDIPDQPNHGRGILPAPSHPHRTETGSAINPGVERRSGNGKKENMPDILAELNVFPEYLKIICDETYRCKTIISNLLNFSRQSEPKLDRIDVNKLIQETLSLIHYQHQSKFSSICLDLSKEPCTVAGDAQQLKQVFMNLLINALHAIEVGGEIVISTRRRQASIQVMVKDSGAGISPESLDKIFDPFFTTKPTGKGTGLGLAICYGIIEVHNGRIEATSEGAGKGATFTITLPLAI